MLKNTPNNNKKTGKIRVKKVEFLAIAVYKTMLVFRPTPDQKKSYFYDFLTVKLFE